MPSRPDGRVPGRGQVSQAIVGAGRYGAVVARLQSRNRGMEVIRPPYGPLTGVGFPRGEAG